MDTQSSWWKPPAASDSGSSLEFVVLRVFPVASVALACMSGEVALGGEGNTWSELVDGVAGGVGWLGTM